MELDLIGKIAVAVAMPVIVCVMSWAVYAAQTRWEIRREKQFWENRNAWWAEGGIK